MVRRDEGERWLLWADCWATAATGNWQQRRRRGCKGLSTGMGSSLFLYFIFFFFLSFLQLLSFFFFFSSPVCVLHFNFSSFLCRRSSKEWTLRVEMMASLWAKDRCDLSAVRMMNRARAL
jgi:hypothetical protein